MADVYSSADARKLLTNKFVVFIGSSVVRTMYKDFVVLLQEDKYMTDTEMRTKGEWTYKGDRLLEGGQFGKMHNGVNYREVREYKTDTHWLKFYFITRIFGEYMKEILKEFNTEPKPDVIIINSGIWDVNRYGAKGPEEFQRRLPALLDVLKEQTPEDAIVLFCTSLPVSEDCKGGFLTPETEFMRETLSLQIMAANSAFFHLVPPAGFDLLDLHYLLRYHVHRRCEDGIHWDMTAHRLISNMLFTHLTEAWGMDFPGNSSKMDELENLPPLDWKNGHGLFFHSEAGFDSNNNNNNSSSNGVLLDSVHQIPPSELDIADPIPQEPLERPMPPPPLLGPWEQERPLAPVPPRGLVEEWPEVDFPGEMPPLPVEQQWQPRMGEPPAAVGRGRFGQGIRRGGRRGGPRGLRGGPRDVPRGGPRNVPRGGPRGGLRNVPRGGPRDVPRGGPRNVPRGGPRDVLRGVPRDVPRGGPRDVPRGGPRDVPRGGPRDVPRGGPRDVPRGGGRGAWNPAAAYYDASWDDEFASYSDPDLSYCDAYGEPAHCSVMECQEEQSEEEFHSAWMQKHRLNVFGKSYLPNSSYRYHPY